MAISSFDYKIGELNPGTNFEDSRIKNPSLANVSGNAILSSALSAKIKTGAKQEQESINGQVLHASFEEVGDAGEMYLRLVCVVRLDNGLCDGIPNPLLEENKINGVLDPFLVDIHETSGFLFKDLSGQFRQYAGVAIPPETSVEVDFLDPKNGRCGRLRKVAGLAPASVKPQGLSGAIGSFLGSFVGVGSFGTPPAK